MANLTYHIYKCNTCGFVILHIDPAETSVDQELESHKQDHVAVNHSEPSFIHNIVDSEVYYDEMEFEVESWRQFQSEMKVGYMGGSATYSQWYIHTEMIPDGDDPTEQ